MNPWKWAAASVVPICIAFFTYYLVDSSQTVGAPFIVKADKGDKATIELPDGTNVVLNSASQLSYLNNFGENVRRVQLNGEAYFKVAHDEKHAFIVQVSRSFGRKSWSLCAENIAYHEARRQNRI